MRFVAASISGGMILIRHHCGTENAENAKFCKGCGERLLPAAAPSAVAGVGDRGQESLIPPYEPPAEPAARSPVSTAAPASPLHAMPEPADPGNRTTIAVLVVVVAIALACGAAWWAMSGKKTSEPVESSAPAAESTQMSGPPVVVPVASSQGKEAQTRIQPDNPDAKSVQRDDEAKARQREAQAKRRAEQEAKRKAEQEERQRTAEAARQREMEERQRLVEARRRASMAPQADLRSPQQVCAERPNFISRNLCETRECKRPDRANHPYCIALNERQKPTHNEALPLN